MKNDNKRNKKPGNKIGREDSAGQNPFWPGEGAQQAGTFPGNRGEEIQIPIVDSVQEPSDSDA